MECVPSCTLPTTTSSSSGTVCQYCSSSYCDPRILACLHSFCLQCISRIHTEEDTTKDSSIICPSCNHRTPIPNEGGVASLPVNIRLSYEVKQDGIIKKVMVSPPPSCESCEEETSPLVAYCKDCNDMLCNECWKLHKKLKMSKFHSTFPLIDLKKKPRQELVKMMGSSTSSDPMCPHHNDQKLDLYCIKCNIPVCVRCTLSDKHNTGNGHTVQEIEDRVKQKKINLINNIKRLPEKKEQLEQLLKRINKTKINVQGRKKEVDDIIRETFVKLRQLIDQREKELLAQNTEIALSKETCLSIQQEGIQQLVQSIKYCLSLTSTAISEYSNVQLLAIANTLHNRAITLQQQYIHTPLDPCDTPSITPYVDTGELENLITQFGGVADSSADGSNCYALVPRRILGLGATMKVKVVTRDKQGKELTTGDGTTVRGMLSHDGRVVNDSLAITDNNNGTYIVNVIDDQQLGQHQLSITVNGQSIEGSPFDINIIPQRDYTKLKKPTQIITGIKHPQYIAFSDNGDMFVTSNGDHRIHVYDKSGNKKTTIGSGKGNGPLQFQCPFGIDINGEVVYVAEWNGDRIHKLTTGGEFIDTFGGEKGSAIEQFNCPYDVKISPTDGKVFVADSSNDCVQVFNPDWSISHVIDGTVSGDSHFSSPEGIAFDLSGDVHISSSGSSSVAVYTANGQFIRCYGDETCINGGGGIAIDPSGYCLVVSYSNRTLCVFDDNGIFNHSVGGLNFPYGVAISPIDRSVWVADTGNHRLVKY